MESLQIAKATMAISSFSTIYSKTLSLPFHKITMCSSSPLGSHSPTVPFGSAAPAARPLSNACSWLCMRQAALSSLQKPSIVLRLLFLSLNCFCPSSTSDPPKSLEQGACGLRVAACRDLNIIRCSKFCHHRAALKLQVQSVHGWGHS